MAGIVTHASFAFKKQKKVINATVPIATLISDFEDFARLVEGGELSSEAQQALLVLKNHAEQKCLPPQNQKLRAFEKDDRKNEWCDMRCFEKEMAKSTDDDERISIISHWMKKYTFDSQSWRTWCINKMEDSKNRNKMRYIFDTQEAFNLDK